MKLTPALPRRLYRSPPMSFVDPSAGDPVDPGPQATRSAPPLPTWRDLPREPPYGPVAPPRTAHIGAPFPAAEIEEEEPIGAGHVALAVGATLLLVAVGIGAALFLLRDDDPRVTLDPPPTLAPAEVDPPPVDPQPTPDPRVSDPSSRPTPEGEPSDAPRDNGGREPAPDPQPSRSGDPTPSAPAQPDPPPEEGASSTTEEEGDASLDLPRLFVLRTLPLGLSETSTTTRQTTSDAEVVSEEQTTLLATAEGEEATVHAVRADDAAARLESLVPEGAQDISVLGLPGYLLADSGRERRLVYLMPGATETLIQITVPDALETDALLTIAQGLELVR